MTEEWRDKLRSKSFIVDACKKCEGIGRIYDPTSTAPSTACDRCEGTGNEKDEQERLESFISQQRKEAAREALEASAREIEKDIYEQEEGKIYSKIAAKCLEAPFPEIAVDHAIKRYRERAVSIINKHIEDL